jgi:hypothetical protein
MSERLGAWRVEGRIDRHSSARCDSITCLGLAVIARVVGPTEAGNIFLDTLSGNT